MSNRAPTPLWLLVLLALVGAPLAVGNLTPGKSASSSTPVVASSTLATRPPLASSSSERTRQQGPARYCVARFVSVVGDALGYRPATGFAEGLLDVDSPKSSREDWTSLLELGAAEVFVMTVPDPIDSGLGYQFETLLQAALRGFESSGYRRAQAWLPWEDGADGKKEHSEACRYELPGVVLLWKESELALLLLVGETPTGGVHAKALGEALELHDALRIRREPAILACNRGCDSTESGHGAECRHLDSGLSDVERYRLLGPTFSGSARSIRQALECRRAGAWVVSGSATGADVEATLLSCSIEFAHTGASEDESKTTYLRFLRDEIGVDEGEIAFLSEAGTGFGSSFAVKQGPPGGQRSSGESNTGPLRAEFPANIGSLRDAYEAQGEESFSWIGPRTRLDASLKERRLPVGLAGEPSGKTILARDTAVDRLIRALTARGVRHVVLTATDVGDVLFLARKFQQLAPGIRVATFHADALLLHPEFRREMYGSLVVSPYLTKPSRDVDDTFRSFESTSAEGVFHAARRLVGYRDTNPKPRVAVVGDGTFLPLRDENGQSSSTRGRWTAALFWVLFPFAVSVFALVDLWLLRRADAETWKSRDSIAEKPLDLRVATAIERTKWSVYALLRRFVLLVLVLLVGLVSLTPATPEVLSQLQYRSSRGFFFVVSSVTALALVFSLLANGTRLRRMLAVLGDHGRLLSGDHARSWASTAVRAWLSGTHRKHAALVAILQVVSGAVFASLLVAAVVCLLLAAGVAEGSAPHWFFTVRRARSLIGGASPLAPVFWTGVALYVWLVGQMARLRLVHGVTRMTPFDRSVDGAATPIHGILDQKGDRPSVSFEHQGPALHRPAFETFLERDVIVALVRPIADRTRALLVLLVLGIAVVAFFVVRVETLETPLVGRLIFFVIFVGYSVVCVLLVQLFRYWLAMELLLKAILQHPIGRVFDKVAKFVVEPVDEQISRTPNDTLRLAACADEFQRLELRRQRTSVGVSNKGVPETLPLSKTVHELLASYQELVPEVRERTAFVAAAEAINNAASLLTGRTRADRAEAAATELEISARVLMDGAVDRMAVVPQPAGDGVLKWPSPINRFAAAVDDARDALLSLAHPGNDWTKAAAELRVAAEEALANVERGKTAELEAKLGAEVLHAARLVMTTVTNIRVRCARQSSSAFDQDRARWLTDAEAFVATVVAIVVNRHVRQLAPFVWTALVTSVLLMVSVRSYPFEPQRALLGVTWVLVIASVFASIGLYLQFDRNSLLSRIAQTTPGEVTPSASLVYRVLAWAIVPLIAALAAEYPDLVNAVISPLVPFGLDR